MPKVYPKVATSVILGVILGLGIHIPGLVRSFQALSHLKSGVALDRRASADLKDSSMLQKAIAEYREASRLKPDFAPARYQLADALHLHYTWEQYSLEQHVYTHLVIFSLFIFIHLIFRSLE